MAGEGKVQLDEKSHEVVARLLGRIVHDFNNPLAAILGFSDLLRNPKLMPEKREKYISRIYEQAVKLSQLVENMSYFSAMPSVEAVRLNLGRTVQDFCALRKTGIASSGIELSVEAAAEVKVVGDRAAVARILHSLLNNVEQAFKENPQIKKKAASVHCFSGDGVGVVEVGDSGPGIPTDEALRVFDPFYSTRRAGGLGLGLTVSRRLAEGMNGTLELLPSPSPLGGALFRLTLPGA